MPLPKKAVSSPDALRALLDEYWPQLRERAFSRFASERPQDVEAAMSRVRTRMEAHGSYDHPLQQLLNQVRGDLRTLARRRRAREKWLEPGEQFDELLVDPVLGRLEGAKLEAVMGLPEKSRETMLRVARGESPAEIARSEGRSPGVVRVRLAAARARVLRDAALAWLPLLWPRRLLRIIADSPPVAAIAPLIAVVTLGGSAPAMVATVGVPTHPVAYRTDNLPTTRSPEVPRPSATTAVVTQPTVHISQSAGSPRGAAAETPDDVRLTSVGTRGMEVVAIGFGNQCQCRVLMRSDDGGATWIATDGPPKGVTQIVLPKNYPADPRIFGGVDPHGTSSPYEVNQFGGPWQAITNLPPGELAVSGDRIYVAAVGGVWSTDGTSARQDVATPTDQITMSISAVADDGWIWAPAGAVPGTLNAWTAPVLLHCNSSSCSVVTTMPANPGVLGNGYAYTRADYYAIDGSHVATFPAPSGAAILTAAPGLIAVNINGTYGIERMRNGYWSALPDNDLVRTHGADQLAIAGQSVMALFSDAGYRCIGTSNVWLNRCPKP